ncbi:IclR family transcriptional regulator [Teichococcus deserti]|uniref:IclR family transcriptional regulator n=1 Tax=Teichococcus deserti TaxID=1817963 RepID=UPI001F605196|nr:helix-turn-helix domain-containing protein [Pseudoroseomonas deserti]
MRALDRGLALLAAFTPEQPRRSLTELAAAAGLDKGTARRLLHTLLQAGFLRLEDGRYALATRILALAAAVETGGRLRAAAAGQLRALAAECRATAFIWVAEEGRALCLDRALVELPDVEALWFAVGAHATLNGGAGPRVLLAWLDPAAQRQALALPLTRRTPAGETDPPALLRAAAAIRARGHELVQDDFVIGLGGLGVPILGRDGALLGALSIATLSSAFAPDATGQPPQLAALRRAAGAIAAAL